MGSVPSHGFYSGLGRARHRKRRHLDVQRSIRLADEQLDPDPLTVSLVQVATTLPIFLLAIPAGALADIADRRIFLLIMEVAVTAVSPLFAGFVSLDLVTPRILLLFAFLIGVGGALSAPGWQAIVPSLVPKEDLAPAVSANSVGFNISRAIGPALGGAIIAAFGIAAPFWLNATSNLGVVGALWWWRPPQTRGQRLPAEGISNAIVAGVRYARHNRRLRATMIRAVGFFLVGSAYWALLPLVARQQIVGGPELYGILLGAIGTGAVIGAFGLECSRGQSRKRSNNDDAIECHDCHQGQGAQLEHDAGTGRAQARHHSASP